MSSTETGRAAEELAAEWLEDRGFKVLDRNWRNRWCEIDIVATVDGSIHFIEVKYRARAIFGHGFDYVDHKKATRLRRAALMWLGANGRNYVAYQIDAIAITGSLKPQNLVYLANAISGV